MYNFEEVPPVRCKRAVTKKLDEIRSPEPKPKRISASDYKAWENFDADKECKKIEEASKPAVLSEEEIKKLTEKANECKDKGNKFVQKKDWNSAIKSYSEAIDYYANEPIFYANRALCYLKTEDYTKVLEDCAIALDLNSNYVKALQRRAAANMKLKSWLDAQTDLKKVLQIEPHNKESIGELKKVEEVLQKNSGNVLKNEEIVKTPSSLNLKETSATKSIWKDDKILIKPIEKPPNLRSKKPMKTIKIKEVDIIDYAELTNKTPTMELPGLNLQENISEPLSQNLTDFDIANFSIPKTFLQFTSVWKTLSSTAKFQYLMAIPGDKFVEIFEDFMESDLFSEFINILSGQCAPNNCVSISKCLNDLSVVKRFSMLVIFMTEEDKESVNTILQLLKTTGSHEETIRELSKKYELI